MKLAAKPETRARLAGSPERFHFHHRAGACVGLDLTGVDLPSAEAALTHAYVLVLDRSRMLLSRAVPHAIEVTDAAGVHMFDVPFTTVVVPRRHY